MTELISLFFVPQIYYILLLIAVDVVLGILSAIKKKDFRLGKLANFMAKSVLGYVLSFVILRMAIQAWPVLLKMYQAAYILIILSLFGSIMNNLSRIGMRLPDYLKK